MYIIAQFNREVKIECIFDIRNGAWIFKVTMTCINELENQFNLLGIYYNWSNCLLKKVYLRYIFILEDALSVWANLGQRLLFVWLISLWHRCNHKTLRARTNTIFRCTSWKNNGRLFFQTHRNYAICSSSY